MKKIILTCAILFGTLFISCLKPNQGDCDPVNPYFLIKALESYNLNFTNSGPNPWAFINARDTIKWDNYFVRIGFKCEYIAEKKSKNGYYFGNELFALSCLEPGYKGSLVGVKNIYFITINDYNSNYLKNDTLNEIIKINDWTSYPKEFNEFVSINDFINKNNNGFSDQSFEFKTTEQPNEKFNLTQFKVVLELKNGEMFETNTKEVMLRE